MLLRDIFSKMGSLGFLGLEYEPEFGGQGGDHLFTVILAEEFGRCDHGSLPMALGVQVDMATLLSPSMELPSKKRNTSSLRCREQTSALSQ